MTVVEKMNLGNRIILSKIDRLRETNAGAIVPLPQLVVVGDQSSGKSSLLESLTGFSFPRGASLCTRYATQITCAREAQEKILVTIIPRPDADSTLKNRLLAFRRELRRMDNEDLTKIFEEANAVMGIRMSKAGDLDSSSAFSQDILKIEISGPDQAHLTVIDVPGIFRVPQTGLTSQRDVDLVRNIVKSYMENSRTIILAVMPCNVDVATQEILTLAEEADPDGIRTMGVLTKADLATERATQDAVIDLVEGRRNVLKLGYYVVKNRSADDNTSTTSDLQSAEQAHFMAPPWASIRNRCGIPALKLRLQELLMDISKRELPNVKGDIEKRMRERTTKLEAMGEPRADESSQRQYLVKIASRMQDVNKSALNGYYAGEVLFKKKPELKLITKIIKLGEVFANLFWKRGHYQDFGPTWDYEGETTLEGSTESTWATVAPGSPLSDDVSIDACVDLQDIIDTDYECPEPLRAPMAEAIREAYDSSRGPELGTFNGTVLASVFEIASQKWQRLALSHTSKAIVLVHNYIYNLLNELCPDATVRDQIWETILEEELRKQYECAIKQTKFLLDIERSSRPATFNHYFNAALQKRRQQRLAASLKRLAVSVPTSEHVTIKKYIPLDQLEKHTTDKSNRDQVCEDILDALVSYYKVARKRFVDTLYQQVINHMLLHGPESPLKIFSADRILKLSPEQLEMIAGEDTVSKNQRHILTRELDNLKEAIKVLRT